MHVGRHVRLASIRLSTGPRLHYAEQTGSRPVLFLHGWPDSGFSFSRILPLLPSSLHAFAIDQRGFGDSDRPDDGYTIEQFAADAIAFLDARSIERASIVGHSFGSFVARQVAIDYPQRVERLVLIGTGATAVNPVTREVQASIRTLEDPVPYEFAREFQASTACVPLPEEFFEWILSETLKLPARLWRETFDQLLAHDDTASLGRITAPTLLLWGERDALFSREDQDRVVSAIAGARLTVYAETGHCPNWERPELVAADLARFVARS